MRRPARSICVRFCRPPRRPTAESSRRLAADLYAAVFAVGGHGERRTRRRDVAIGLSAGRVRRTVPRLPADQGNLRSAATCSIRARSSAPTRRFLATRSGRWRPSAVEVVPFQLRWNADALLKEAVGCNGCGMCKTQSPEARMCPFFRAEPREESSPAPRPTCCATISRAGSIRTNGPRETMKELSDLCFNCKQCQLECPSNVNIPQMMIEAKAAQVAAHGMSRADWILSRAHSFGWLGSTASLAMNWAIGNAAARWCLEKLVGISSRRKLPLFARRSFMSSVRRDLLKTPRKNPSRRPAVYFVGRLCQLARSGAGPGLSRGARAQRNQRARAAGPNVVGNGHDFRGRSGGGAGSSPSGTFASWPNWPAKDSRSSAPSRRRPCASSTSIR